MRDHKRNDMANIEPIRPIPNMIYVPNCNCVDNCKTVNANNTWNTRVFKALIDSDNSTLIG